MWPGITSVVSVCLLALLGHGHGHGSVIPRPNREHQDEPKYDVVVVGGGPSGLAALSGLARVRRNALLIDSGHYRNGPTRKMHDVLGFDGVTPAYYRHATREQISFYDTVTMVNGTVIKIEPKNNNSLFTVTADFDDEPPLHGNRGRRRHSKDGKIKTKTVDARKIILATGLRDVLPETPGLREAWGKGIYWCPWCDGIEYAGQPLGLLGSLDKIPHMARPLATLNTDLIALVNGTDTPEMRAETEKEDSGWETYLEMQNIPVDNRTIESITRLGGDEDDDEDGDGDDEGGKEARHDKDKDKDSIAPPSVPHSDLFRVDFTQGPSVERSAFLSSWPSEQASSVGEDMGVALLDGRLVVDAEGGMLTSIPGVYAVGDANSDNSTNVPHALYSGKRAAVFLHMALETEMAEEMAEEAGQGGRASPQHV